MFDFQPYQWVLLGILVALYAFWCGRVARLAGRVGRSPVAWFFIVFFCTAIPAMIVFRRDAARRAADEGEGGAPNLAGRERPADERAMRCAHCHQLVTPSELDGSGGIPTCPHCNLPLEKDALA